MGRAEATSNKNRRIIQKVPMGQIKGKIKHPWASRLGLSCFLQVKTLIVAN